ncbi:MAG: PQQ-dependent sugar dehydrogenase [Thermoleophilaceae bacterium]
MRRLLLIAAAMLLAAPAAHAARLERVGHFRQPLYVTSSPSDRRDLFVVERAGRVLALRSGRVLRRPVLDIRRRVLITDRRVYKDQGGLLSVAFAPDYARSHRLYAFFTGRDNTIRVEEFPGRRTLVSLPRTSPFDAGGQLAFGPDGALYIGMGYGGGDSMVDGSALDPASPRGKILRWDPARPAAAPEPFVLGLRTPWRFSFDRGNLIVADVGDSKREEVDFLPKGHQDGASLGWPAFEGTLRHGPFAAPGAVPPVLQKRHASGWCALIGGYVVRDPSLRRLSGRYLYGDLCKSGIRSVRLSARGATGDRSERLVVPNLVSFGEDARGRLYAVSLDGWVYRFAG